jgi:hypothetical protein
MKPRRLFYSGLSSFQFILHSSTYYTQDCPKLLQRKCLVARYYYKAIGLYLQNGIPVFQIDFSQTIKGSLGLVEVGITNLTFQYCEITGYKILVIPYSTYGKTVLERNLLVSLHPSQTQVLEVFDYRPRIDLSTIEVSIVQDTQI